MDNTNKAERMRLLDDVGANGILIGMYKKKDGDILHIDCCRKLTTQEIYIYTEMFLKYFLDELSKGDESYLTNTRDKVKYEIKRIKLEE